jgi:hypothetical protein
MAVFLYALSANNYSLFNFTANFHLTNPAVNYILKNRKTYLRKGGIYFVGLNDKSYAQRQRNG